MRRALGVTLAVVGALWLLVATAQAQEYRPGGQVVIRRGTRLALVVDQYGRTREMRPGLRVHLRVDRDVVWQNQVLIAAGTPVAGVTRRYDVRGGYHDVVALRPVRALDGTPIPLESLRVRDVFVLGRPLRWRDGARVAGVVAWDVTISVRDDHRERDREPRRDRDREDRRRRDRDHRDRDDSGTYDRR